MTAEEFVQLPDDGHRYELVRGRLIEMPPSAYGSSMVGSLILAAILAFVRPRGLGIVGGEGGGVVLARGPDTVRAPDVSFIRRERVDDPHRLLTQAFPGAPDLAVEVLSPTDRPGDVADKITEYLAAGTRLVWVVDAEARAVAVFHADALPAFLFEDGVLDGEDVIPGFALPLAGIWI